MLGLLIIYNEITGFSSKLNLYLPQCLAYSVDVGYTNDYLCLTQESS